MGAGGSRRRILEDTHAVLAEEQAADAAYDEEWAAQHDPRIVEYVENLERHGLDGAAAGARNIADLALMRGEDPSVTLELLDRYILVEGIDW
jgi:hypothetical protein